jgi:cytochrome b561
VPPGPTRRGFSGRNTVVAITRHRVMALGILALAAVGPAVVHSKIPLHRKFELYQLHKSVGDTILVAAGSDLMTAAPGPGTGGLP